MYQEQNENIYQVTNVQNTRVYIKTALLWFASLILPLNQPQLCVYLWIAQVEIF